MKTPYIIALVAGILYLLYKNQSQSTGTSVGCATCGGTVGITAVPTPVQTIASDTTQQQIPVPVSNDISSNTYIPPSASPQHPILLASNDPTVSNFFMSGTPSAFTM